eukprot:1483778-Rhodomonas_salina.1
MRSTASSDSVAATCVPLNQTADLGHVGAAECGVRINIEADRSLQADQWLKETPAPSPKAPPKLADLLLDNNSEQRCAPVAFSYFLFLLVWCVAEKGCWRGDAGVVRGGYGRSEGRKGGFKRKESASAIKIYGDKAGKAKAKLVLKCLSAHADGLWYGFGPPGHADEDPRDRAATHTRVSASELSSYPLRAPYALPGTHYAHSTQSLVLTFSPRTASPVLTSRTVLRPGVPGEVPRAFLSVPAPTGPVCS